MERLVVEACRQALLGREESGASAQQLLEPRVVAVEWDLSLAHSYEVWVE